MAAARTDRLTPSFLDAPRQRTAHVATVAPIAPIDQTYSYIVPDEWAATLRSGMRVEIPLGRNQRRAVGFCVDVSRQAWNSTLKELYALLDDRPVLSEKMLELGRWVARYYAAHLGRTLDLMVPTAAKRQAGWRKVRSVHLPGGAGAVPPAGGKPLPPRQADVLRALADMGGAADREALCARAGCPAATLATLARKGLVEIRTRLEPLLPAPAGVQRHEPDYELNADQRAAVNQIATAVAARRFSVQVLFGVTGSGKTEVYVAAIRQALSEGRQAILLVPEIALTTQTAQRLAARFDSVVVLHSGLSAVERSRAWAAVSCGAVPVVIGTRSAVFAPCPSLGVIIVDEEAEPSYKNQAAPRYHTRDVAIARGHLEGIPVVLGSATPSLETWSNVQRRRHYQLIRLPHRVRGLALPSVHLVNMHDEHHARRGVHLLSRAMEWHLQRTLDRGEQAVLMLNRRGYASYLHCPRCREVIQCPHCAVRMVFHATTGLAHCHYCHAREPVPDRCRTAGCAGSLVRFGIGTQRVEQELHEKFPTARVRRMDSDAMERPADYARVLGAFERKEFDILLGTQMIAKGLDFPFVSFVGVISADTALALNDFRAEERTFQLVQQVAGRSGRGEVGGHVVVQTFAADSEAVRHAVEGNYEAFAAAELQRRRLCRLPPHTRMVRLVLSDRKATKLDKAAGDLATRLGDLLARRGIQARLFGPQPAPITRIRDLYRQEIQLTFAGPDAMLPALDLFRAEAALRTRAHGLVIDVDPVSLQ
jgi:primosomal protein N' (replication factor Y)